MKPAFSVAQIAAMIREVPDFPKPGIRFKDITPVLADAQAFHSLIHHMAEAVPKHATHIASIESRGFILGAALALHLRKGLVLIRKPGKLPFSTFSHSYELEYGKDTLQIHVDALKSADHVCIVDDVLATGGTASAAEKLCLESGASVTGFAFLLELECFHGYKNLKANIHSLIKV